MLRSTVTAMLAAALAGTAAAPLEAQPRERRKEVVRFLGAGGARLGLSLEDVGRDDLGRLKLAEEKGALVTDVQEGSAAARAGLQVNDVVLRYHGEAVLSAGQLARMVRETPPGRTVPLEVSRDGAVQRVSATLEKRKGHAFLPESFDFEMPEPPERPERPELPALGEAPAPPLPPRLSGEDGRHPRVLRDVVRLRSPRRLGVAYQELSGQLARYFKVEDGLLVTTVDEGSPAAQAGLQAGDVILKFAGESIGDGGDLREAVDEAKGEVTVTVQREGRPMDLKVKLAPASSRGERRPTT